MINTTKHNFIYTFLLFFVTFIVLFILFSPGNVIKAQDENTYEGVFVNVNESETGEFDEISLSELGISFEDLVPGAAGKDIDFPDPIMKIPKGRLGKEDWWGQMSYNITGGNISAMSYQTEEGFRLTLQDFFGVDEASAQTSSGGSSSSSGSGSGGTASQVTGILNIINNPQNAVLEPFGGVAWGFPCCNGWFYYHTTCGKCDDAGVLDSTTHMAWWFALKKYYLPTLSNPVLGTAIDYESDCWLLIYIPYICNVCECELEAEYTDFVVGTAKDSSKSSQTTASSGSGGGGGAGGGGTVP